MEPSVTEDQRGLSRRDVLRRGAVLGGAMMWTVPAVQTLAGPAFAAGSPCVGSFTYQDSRGQCVRVQYLPDTACCDCVDTKSAALGGSPAAAVVAGFLCQIVGQCRFDSANSGTC